MNYPFRNLVFEGGGVKGIAYVGALRELQRRKILKDIQRVGGTSAGAINAVLLSLGYTPSATERILMRLDFKKFMDDSPGLLRDTKRLIDEFGWYKGDFFHEWIGRRIKRKTGKKNSTFADLRKDKRFRDLFIIGTNLSTGFAEIFSAEHTPRMRVVDAVRISMSIPIFFAAVKRKGGVYVDGGVLDNYPVKLFDRLKYVDRTDRRMHARRTPYYEMVNRKKARSGSPFVYNKETLGFRLDSGREIAVFRDGARPQRKKIKNFINYAGALLTSLMGVQDNQHLHGDDWQRTVYIDTIGVSTTEFSLRDRKKRRLISEGTKGVKQYLDWWEKGDPGKLPANHPDFREPS